MVVSAVDRAVRDFAAWNETGGGRRPGAGAATDVGAGTTPEVCTGCLYSVLKGRAAYLNGKDPTRWRRGDARAVLYELAVPRLSERCDLIAHTVPTVDAFLDFLDRTGRLHPASAAARYLREELAQHAAGFPAAMADRSRFRMAKTLYEAMLADDIDIDDDEAVDAWTARFNVAPQAERVAVLEHLLVDQPGLATAQFAARAGKVAALAPGQGEFDSRNLLPAEDRLPDELPTFAPVEVPSRAEAAQGARRSRLLADLLALARWFGQGRKVAKDGEPVPADVRALADLLGQGLPAVRVSRLHQVGGVQLLFWLARRLELVDLRRTGLVAGPALAGWQAGDALATAADDAVLDLWWEVFALVNSGRVVPEEAITGKNAENTAFYAATRHCTPSTMVDLYRSAALDQDNLVADLITPHLDHLLDRSRSARLDVDEAELVDVSLRFALCLPLDYLVDHGALQLCGPGAQEFDPAPRFTPLGLPTRTVKLAANGRIQARLTPLGRWAMRESLLAEGAEAPAAETPAAETRAAETRAAETPAVETRAAETRAAETRAAETPAAETRAAETRAAETRAAEAARR